MMADGKQAKGAQPLSHVAVFRENGPSANLLATDLVVKPIIQRQLVEKPNAASEGVPTPGLLKTP